MDVNDVLKANNQAITHYYSPIFVALKHLQTKIEGERTRII